MRTKFFFVLVITLLIASCSNNGSGVTEPAENTKSVKSAPTSFVFDFNLSDESWIGGFSDCPVDNDFYDLANDWKRVQGKLGGTYKKALYITGDNHSDDLFMFFKKQITGLAPNTTYQVNYNFDIINDIAEGLFGIGGSPGESVFMKFGAVNYEPMSVLNETGTAWLMNIDKANQSQSGNDMHQIGNVANPLVDYNRPKLAPKNFDSYAIGFDFQVTTDANGSVWVIVGTDSGFEGTTFLYYDNMTVIFDEVIQ